MKSGGSKAGASKFLSGGYEDASRLSELSDSKVPVANIGLTQKQSIENANERPEEEVPRPELDLFKSIFSDDSSSSEDEEIQEARIQLDQTKRPSPVLDSIKPSTFVNNPARSSLPAPTLPVINPPAQAAPMKLTLANTAVLDLLAKAQKKESGNQLGEKGGWIEKDSNLKSQERHQHTSKKKKKDKDHKVSTVLTFIESHDSKRGSDCRAFKY